MLYTETEPTTPKLQPDTPDLNFQPMQQDAVVTINHAGTITDCNQPARELLGWDAEALAGHPITDAIPELPFTANTPGYNLAFAVFHSANTAWTRRLALMANGHKIFVDTALSSVKIGYRRYIQLSLRSPSPLN